MKRYSEKKLYNTTISKLLKTKFYKGDTSYIFAYYTYEKGVYQFFFVPEKDKDKNPLYDEVKMIVNTLYWQHTNDYKDTYELNCQGFDKCESITA